MKLIQVYANNIIFTLKIKLCLCKVAVNYLLFPFSMLFIYLYQTNFFIFRFPIITMYILNIAIPIKEWQSMGLETLYTWKELNLIKKLLLHWNIRKKDLLKFANKSIEKYLILVIPKDTTNLIWRKKLELVKQSKTVSQEPKTSKNPNIVDINSAFTEHSKTSHKLSRTIIQVGECCYLVVLIKWC